jgi:DNA-binding LacI/PurR family transcriptional regulator
VRVPEDVAVVGFDGLLDEKLPARRLVTIRCPWVEAAVMATDLLVRQINGEKVAVETCLPVTLCPGDTA